MIVSYLSGEKILSSSKEAFLSHEKSRFGEKKEGKIEYSPIEALYLLANKKMTVFSGKKEIFYDNLLKKERKKDKKIELKLLAFSDMRKKGYILKTALKFGAEFRAYEKGKTPDEEHAKWLIYTVKSSDLISWHDFAAKNRIAHSTRKNLLLAVCDEESDITYYEISWKKI